MTIESLSFILPPLAVATAAASLYLARRYRRERDDAREQAARVWNQVRDVQRNLPEMLNRLRKLEREDAAGDAGGVAATEVPVPASAPVPAPASIEPDEAEPVILKFRRRREWR